MSTTLLESAPSSLLNTIETATLFHLGLYVADLERSLAFYRLLFQQEPSKMYPNDYAEFEISDPPLLLALTQHPLRKPGGVLNHVGLRYTDETQVDAVAQRLEAAGLATRREEQTACCYARQSKCWITDPDYNLWEIYVLFEDLPYSGFGGTAPPLAEPAPEPALIWEHKLGDSWSTAVALADGVMDEVRLCGTFNGDLNPVEQAALLAQAQRVLRPGGKVVVQGLVGDRPFPGAPDLPGLASKVRYVPVIHEPVELLQQAGFVDLYYEQIGDIKCFKVNGVELHKVRLSGRRPAEPRAARIYHVLYKGPFSHLVGDDGTVYRRGETIAVPAQVWDDLRNGPAADQFVLLAEMTSLQ